MYLAENLKKYRLQKNLTQEEVAAYLSLTSQSISKWERNESYPDITFLPTLANLFETSIDLLLGMDAIRAEDALTAIHKEANNAQKKGDLDTAVKTYRDALRLYPNDPGMILGLANALALNESTEEAIHLMERGLPLSNDEKQKATTRAALCFLYLKAGQEKNAAELASTLPHVRECRETIEPLIFQSMGQPDIDRHIKTIILGS